LFQQPRVRAFGADHQCPPARLDAGRNLEFDELLVLFDEEGIDSATIDALYLTKGTDDIKFRDGKFLVVCGERTEYVV